MNEPLQNDDEYNRTVEWANRFVRNAAKAQLGIRRVPTHRLFYALRDAALSQAEDCARQAAAYRRRGDAEQSG